MEIYIVKSGDTAAEIAARFGVSFERFLADNGLQSSEFLVPGQAVVIQSPSEVVTAGEGDTLASIAAATGTEDFTVSGDTLTITSPTAFTEETTLRLNDGAKLNLAFSGTLKVRRIYVDGVHQRSGNYTTGDADWIAGGTGHIEMGKGLIMVVR